MTQQQDDEMSYGDFSSELSDPPSTDEEEVPLTKTSAKGKAKAKTAGKGYQIKDALRPPRTAQYTAKSLYDQIIENTIDLDPEYQRDVVWSEQKQSGLIDSILRNYYIPPVIFAVSSSDDGSELRTCIDGKQRLTSIQRFMDGLIPHKDSTTNQKLWFKQVGKSRRNLLPKQYMQKFSYKQITCVEYETLNGDQEREIFQRVQLGVALTPAERMQAITGPWPSLIRDIQDDLFDEDGFEGHLDWGHARGRDFQCLTSIVYLIDKPSAAFPGAQQLEKWLQDNDPVPVKFRNEIFDTFRVYVELARKFNSTFHKPTKLAPIEFVMIGLLVHMYRMKLSLTQLSSAIEKMRADVRGKYIDIRQNSKVTKTMLEFIKKRVKISELKSDKQGDKPVSSKARETKTSAASKRKRAVYSDDESSEIDALKPPPSKSRATAGSSKAPTASSSASKTITKPKTPAKLAVGTKPPLKLAMPTPAITAGSSKPSITKPAAATPRIPKVSNDVSLPTSPHTMAPSLSQRKQSVPPVRPPSAPPSQQTIQREASKSLTPNANGPSERPMPSPGITGPSQFVQDPRPPQSQVQTNFDGASQQQQQSPVVGTPSFPAGTPLAQNNWFPRASIPTSPQNQLPQGQYPQPNGLAVPSSLNGTSSGQFPSGTPPAAPQVPAFVQNPNNPLHSQSPTDTVQNVSSGIVPSAPGHKSVAPNLTLPPQAPQAMRNKPANGPGSIVPPQIIHALPPRPPTTLSPATSGPWHSSQDQSKPLPPRPPTILSSTTSGPWHGSQDQSKPRDRSESHPPSRSRDTRDARGRGWDRGRGRHRDGGRSRSRERDNGWGTRGTGRNRTSRSPTNSRYGEK